MLGTMMLSQPFSILQLCSRLFVCLQWYVANISFRHKQLQHILRKHFCLLLPWDTPFPPHPRWTTPKATAPPFRPAHRHRRRARPLVVVKKLAYGLHQLWRG
jgi:hypothetical protein